MTHDEYFNGCECAKCIERDRVMRARIDADACAYAMYARDQANARRMRTRYATHTKRSS